MVEKKAKKRVLSGMRPTGGLHVGHLLGVLNNWKKLQEEHLCFFFVADWHALTTDYSDTSQIKENTFQMAVDWLASGIDPNKSTMFVQSHVPDHAELHVLLSMITPLSWLERVPTYKEQQQELTNRDLSTYGFLGYPLLQSADIMIYKADFVPVGKDQVPHIEFTREIARRFNFMYKKVFPEPKDELTAESKLLGTDGRKMSKSYDNCIYLSDSPEEITKKVKQMFTDPARKRRTDPGNPDICPVYSWHKLYTEEESWDKKRKWLQNSGTSLLGNGKSIKAEEEFTATRRELPKQRGRDSIKKIGEKDIYAQCQTAEIGCVDCKKILAENLVKALAPIYEKRCEWENKRSAVEEILHEGDKKARDVAQATLEEVREAMGLAL